MARRSDHSRDQLAGLVIAAARGIVETQGRSGVTMRKIAAEIGYSAGSIYNAVGDQEAVLRQVDAATLQGLVACLEAVLADPATASGSLEKAVGIADAYIGYVVENARLWSALLERPPLPGEEVADFYALPRARLIALVGEVIAPFFTDEAALRRSVVALWSSLQGVASLAAGGNLHFLGQTIDPHEIARTIVKRYLSGQD